MASLKASLPFGHSVYVHCSTIATEWLKYKKITFHCRFRLFLVLLTTFGAAGGSGSQLSVVKLASSETISFVELLEAESL